MYAENITDTLLNGTESGMRSELLAAYWIERTYLWILTTIGITGNSLSICTILRMPPVTSSSLYIVFLAIMDSLSLVIKLTVQQLYTFHISIGDIGCRILEHLANSSYMVANWLVVAMTAERLVAIWFPLRVSIISTKITTLLVFGLLVVIFLCLNVVYLYMFHESWADDNSYYCAPLPEYLNFLSDVFGVVEVCFVVFIPCAFLILLNSCIIIGTWRSMSIQEKMTRDKKQINEKKKQQNQITIMMVTVSLVYVICTLPAAIYSMTAGYWITATNKEDVVKNLIGKCLIFLFECNRIVNFFLYFLSGERFRKKFLKMIGCKSCGNAR